jgi:peptidoglycan/LPS O-acetylase OafA/YrhL
MRIAAIDGLRGIAILGVIWHHLIGESWNTPINIGGIHLANNPFAANGWMGVNLFFFLSGFVLYLPYASGRRRMASRADAMRFLLHRAQRLLPLFYVALIVGFIFMARLNELQSWLNFVASLTLVFPFYGPAFSPPGNWVLWSLGTEIYFSLAMPLLLVPIAQFGIVRVVGAALVFAFSVRVLGFALQPPDGSHVNSLCDSLFGRIDDFALGMLAGWLFVRRISLPPACLPLGVVALLAAPVLSDFWYAGQIPGWMQAITYTLINVGLLFCTNALLLHSSAVSRGLSIDLLRWPGIMCFSIYAWHGIVLRMFQAQFPMDHWFSGGPVWPIALCVATIGLLALVSFSFIEFPGQPLRKLLARDVPERLPVQAH